MRIVSRDPGQASMSGIELYIGYHGHLLFSLEYANACCNISQLN